MLEDGSKFLTQKYTFSTCSNFFDGFTNLLHKNIVFENWLVWSKVFQFSSITLKHMDGETRLENKTYMSRCSNRMFCPIEALYESLRFSRLCKKVKHLKF